MAYTRKRSIHTHKTTTTYITFSTYISHLLSLKFIKFAERVWKFAAAREALEKAGWKELDGCLVLPGITPWSVAGTSGAHLKKILISGHPDVTEHTPRKPLFPNKK